MTFKEFKNQFTPEKGEKYEDAAIRFCVALSATNLRWFKTDINGKTFYIEVQDGGTHWKTIQYTHADNFQISLERISQQTVFHSIEITKEDFHSVLNQALRRLVHTSK